MPVSVGLGAGLVEALGLALPDCQQLPEHHGTIAPWTDFPSLAGRSN